MGGQVVKQVAAAIDTAPVTEQSPIYSADHEVSIGCVAALTDYSSCLHPPILPATHVLYTTVID